jgi:MFS family permease
VGGLAGTSFLNDTASEMAYPVLPLFLVGTLGAGPAMLGLIEGLAESTASLARLGGGVLADRLARRKVLVVWGYGLASLVRPLLAVAAAPWHVLTIRFADRLGKGLRSAPRDALLVESASPRRRGAAFGIHRAADHAGSVLGPLLATGILLLAPGELRLLFALTAIPGVLTVLVLLKGVRESPVMGVPSGAFHRLTFASLGPTFPRVLLVLLLFTLGNASDAFLLLRAQELGVPVAGLPILWGVFHLSKTGWSIPGGLLTDRFKPLPLLVCGWILYASVYMGFAVAEAPWQAWILFLVYGLFFGLTESPEKALVAELAPPQFRGRAFGLFHFTVGLAALPASLLFGFLWQWKGSGVAFAAGAGFALLAALLLPLALRGVGVSGRETPKS